jgi:hypothetical protein
MDGLFARLFGLRLLIRRHNGIQCISIVVRQCPLPGGLGDGGHRIHQVVHLTIDKSLAAGSIEGRHGYFLYELTMKPSISNFIAFQLGSSRC